MLLTTTAACTNSPGTGVGAAQRAVWASGQAYASQLWMVAAAPERALTFPSPDAYVDAAGKLPAPIQPGDTPPRYLSQTGDYAHAGSGMVLPAMVGAMRRVALTSHDARDLDIGAASEFPQGGPRVLVDIAPVWSQSQHRLRLSDVAKQCNDLLTIKKFESALLLLNGMPVNDAPETSARFPDAALGHAIVYDGAADMVPPAPLDMPVRQEIHLLCGVGKIWIVDYRFTYPQGVDASAFVSAFMDAVPAP
jgi:hypothetical protein